VSHPPRGDVERTEHQKPSEETAEEVEGGRTKNKGEQEQPALCPADGQWPIHRGVHGL
jgi:hypothetical protein